MKLVIYKIKDGLVFCGVVIGGSIYDVGDIFGCCGLDMCVLFGSSVVVDLGVVGVKGMVILFESVILLLLVLNLDKIICIGFNYMFYIKEIGCDKL